MEITYLKDRISIPGKPAVTIDFFAPVFIKKIKPTAKYKKKVQGVWIASKKINFVYLLTYYMIKENKKRLAGFYPINEKKYAFIEVVIDGAAVSIKFLVIDELPKHFFDMEGRSYDIIIGVAKDLNITPIDLAKLYKTLSPSIRPVYIAASVLLIGMLIFLISELMPEKVEVKPSDQQPRPALTVLEKNYLESLMFSRALEDYKKTQNSLTTDIAFKEVYITVTPTDFNVAYKFNAHICSYYPFNNSKLDGKVYVYQKDTGGSLSKDLEGAKVRTKLKSSYDCLKVLLPYKTTQRDDNSWGVTVKESDYGKITKLFNSLYMCPISTANLKMDDKELNADLKLFTEYKFVEMPPPPPPAK